MVFNFYKNKFLLNNLKIKDKRRSYSAVRQINKPMSSKKTNIPRNIVFQGESSFRVHAEENGIIIAEGTYRMEPKRAKKYSMKNIFPEGVQRIAFPKDGWCEILDAFAIKKSPKNKTKIIAGYLISFNGGEIRFKKGRY